MGIARLGLLGAACSLAACAINFNAPITGTLDVSVGDRPSFTKVRSPSPSPWATVRPPLPPKSPSPKPIVTPKSEAARPDIKVFAGSSLNEFNDGIPEEAYFGNVQGIAAGPDGSTYLSDGKRIRRISPEGTVSTYAGSFWGTLDGPVLEARFKRPTGLAVTQSGEILVADFDAHRIRRIANHQVTTLAGSGEAGLLDGLASIARLNGPTAIALAPNGEVFSWEPKSQAVRAIKDGMVSTLRTDVWESPGQFVMKVAQALDSRGELPVPLRPFSELPQLYKPLKSVVFDAAGYLCYWTSDGRVYRQGPKQDELLASGVFGRLVAVDRLGVVHMVKNPLVIHYRGLQLQADQVGRISGSETLLTAGSSGVYRDGSADRARFLRPNGLAVDGEGALLVADETNNRIRRISAGMVSSVANVKAPGLLCVGTDNSIFVVQENPPGDRRSCRIQKLDTSGNLTDFVGGECGFSDGLGGTARFLDIQQLTMSPNGTLYVTDDHAIRKVAPDGRVLTVAGRVYRPGYLDGEPENALLNQPKGIVAIDGNVYFSDAGNGLLRVLEAGSTVRTVARIPGMSQLAAGRGGQLYGITRDDIFVIGPSGATRIARPGITWELGGIAVGPDGAVYVSDVVKNQILSIKFP